MSFILWLRYGWRLLIDIEGAAPDSVSLLDMSFMHCPGPESLENPNVMDNAICL